MWPAAVIFVCLGGTFAASAGAVCPTGNQGCIACADLIGKGIETETHAELQFIGDGPFDRVPAPGDGALRIVFPNVTAKSDDGTHLGHAECYFTGNDPVPTTLVVHFRYDGGSTVVPLPKSRRSPSRQAFTVLSDEKFANIGPVYTSGFVLNASDIADSANNAGNH